jgi:plasmid maintenance system antidote protein VapI
MGVQYKDLIERMRWAGKLKNDSAVARVLDVTPQALSNYKKRGTVPTDLVLKFAKIFGLSVDWLINGTGDIFRAGAEATKAGAKSYIQAAEETSKNSRHAGTTTDIEQLSPDELIYMGKLLKVMRGDDNSKIIAIQHTIDALLESKEMVGSQAS